MAGHRPRMNSRKSSSAAAATPPTPSTTQTPGSVWGVARSPKDSSAKRIRGPRPHPWATASLALPRLRMLRAGTGLRRRRLAQRRHLQPEAAAARAGHMHCGAQHLRFLVRAAAAITPTQIRCSCGIHAKHALIHYTRLAAQDLAPKIRVNAFAAGIVETDATRVIADDPALRAQIEASTPR